MSASDERPDTAPEELLPGDVSPVIEAREDARTPIAERRPGPSRARLAFGVFLAVAVALLVLEHRAHLLGAWPLLFLAGCIAAHFFMHRGHGTGGGHEH